MPPAPAGNGARRAVPDPWADIRGVGPRIRERLGQLGIHRPEQLLFHLPIRYEDRTRVWPIGTVRVGDFVQIQGQIELSQIQQRGRRALLCHVSDGSGAVVLRFFHFSSAQAKALARGAFVRCFGEVRAGAKGLEMVHPSYQFFEYGDPPPLSTTLTPIYSTVANLAQRRLASLLDAILPQASRLGVREHLPTSTLANLALPTLDEAIRYVHQPPLDADRQALGQGLHPAQRRLALEEMLAHQISLRRLRASMQALEAPALTAGSGLRDSLESRFGFTLTSAQRRVLTELLADLTRPQPMMRLVQGDVGSGKTAVAALAAAQAVSSGFQVAMMAPTELLAEQHFRNLDGWFTPLGVTVAYISGRQSAAERRQTLADLAGGRCDVVVGTHALYQDSVSFSSLGLVIIDEQHRFGVHQRLALREKGLGDGRYPHQLIMTATPIPRTLAMSAYADLDCSVIDELPPGRQPVKTVVVPNERRDDVIERIRYACAAGAQVYWVCTLIEESEHLQCEAAEQAHVRLQDALPEVTVGLVHGRMKAAERQTVMDAFQVDQIQVLVATTVIEVGVDVPNATLMVVENADRLGLSQLHQLRGRVGRGAAASSCVLMYQSPLSEQGKARLGVMRETTDGFEIAEKDLKLRGPGELLGTRQTGSLRFRVADLLRDEDLLPVAKQLADRMIATEPGEASRLVAYWLGDNERYAQA